MKITSELLNGLLEKYKGKIDAVAKRYQYPNNITHLLYLMIPAFVIKYGFSNESLVLKCLEEVPIVINPKEDLQFQAFYYCVPQYRNSKIEFFRGITLNHYQKIGLMQLLDNLVHEMNHAMNALNRGTIEEGEVLLIRSGLVYFQYRKSDLKFMVKNHATLFEEIINTRQTEEIIDVINSFHSLEIHDLEIENTLYAINHSIDRTFQSNAYALPKQICEELLINRTFIASVENFRLVGNIDEIDLWFDEIVGKKGSYEQLLTILNKTFELQSTLGKKVFWKSRTVQKIRDLAREGQKIVQQFNQNCNFR